MRRTCSIPSSHGRPAWALLPPGSCTFLNLWTVGLLIESRAATLLYEWPCNSSETASLVFCVDVFFMVCAGWGGCRGYQNCAEAKQCLLYSISRQWCAH